MSADFIQKVTIVGYNNNCIVKIDKKVFQPSNRLNI
ncbi:hypothetical protein K4H96_2250 [Streptococcus sanguinis]|nr:hypothetical protein [Streptococcus sanguinis]